MRRLVAAVVFVGTIATMPVGASDNNRALPMQFAAVREGPADSCLDKCRVWVSATGMIRAETARDFETFAQGRDLRGATMVLDSEGGSVLGAIALGRSIRRVGLATTVGRVIPLVGDDANDPRGRLSPRADCESMCSFVLLAGVSRYVPPEARVRVHQIWLGDRRDDATAANYTAEDLVLVQRDIGRLAQYTVEMGGSVDLLTVALRIPPWEPMRLLSRDELRRMRLDLSGDRPGEKSADAEIPVPVPVAMPAVATTGGGRIPGPSERGWALSESAGQTVLARRHPLTVEGDDFGSFDLILACGENAAEYTLTYAERRMPGEGQRSVNSLKKVIVAIGQKSANLRVLASDVKPQRPERASLAAGVLPVSLVSALAAPGSRSVVVTTLSGETTAMIRLGNTGLGQNLPALASACAQPGRARATTHATLVDDGKN
jgi:hypothetical protein